MTLIVGIRCADGVVIGADSAATFSTSTGQGTIVQSVSKLRVLPDSPIIMGVSGSVGLGQLYADRVQRSWTNDSSFRSGDVYRALRKLASDISSEAKKSIEAAQLMVPIVGNQLAASSCITESLIALPVMNEAELIQCNQSGNGMVQTVDLPYVSIGSGQSLADPFLAFLRNIFWPNSVPKVVDGIFAITWTLVHAISVSPGGVAGPIQLAVLSKDEGNELSARLLSEEEIGEHRQHVVDVEDYLRRFGDYQSDGASELPEAPKEE